MKNEHLRKLKEMHKHINSEIEIELEKQDKKYQDLGKPIEKEACYDIINSLISRFDRQVEEAFNSNYFNVDKPELEVHVEYDKLF